MTTVFEKVLEGYKSFFENDPYADPRTKNWYLISEPGSLILILSAYLYFCTKAGPWFMKDRQPYNLKNTLIVYNAIQVLISTYLAVEGFSIFSHLNLFCEPIDYSETPFGRRTITACWCYFAAKLSELLDTVFFVLRKKYNQVSFLHLFHHTAMPCLSWLGVRYFGGGHSALFGVLNSFVHIVMYTYYLIAGLGPEYQKYLWWKRYITELQLVQFALIFLHNLYPLFTTCNYPKGLNVLSLVFSGIFLYMFSDFYVKSYLKRSQSEAQEKQKLTTKNKTKAQ